MPYFSRLTDIVTCSLSALLQGADNPQQALEEIVREMQAGVSGAQRSVKSATENVSRLEGEVGLQRQEIAAWQNEAKAALARRDESAARQALIRKHELEDLIAGLDQQLQAAVATRDHLRTTLHALEARLADAERRRHDLTNSQPAVGESASTSDLERPTDIHRRNRVDSELEELRRQLEM